MSIVLIDPVHNDISYRCKAMMCGHNIEFNVVTSPLIIFWDVSTVQWSAEI